MKANLSIVIISLDASKTIEKVLQKACQLSDDVVVVDSFSKDNTPLICQSFPVQFFQQEWLGYSQQKNWANKKAKYDWILSIDADEVLSNNLINEIENRSLDAKYVYSIPFVNIYNKQHIRYGRWRNEKHVRLFPKASVTWNENAVHEGLSIGQHKIQQFQYPIYHYSMSSVEHHEQKAKQYAILGAKKLYRQGKKASFIKRFINPVFRFAMDYFISFGFLDGKNGFHIARITAKETYLKYKHLNELHK